jgi:hypothetical protein
LILENEKKLQMIGTEINGLQQIISKKNMEIARKSEENTKYVHTIEQLLEELKEKSDSEDFDD